MRQKWIERYENSLELRNNYSESLVGFNANLDVIADLEEVDIDLSETEPEKKDRVDNIQDFRSLMKYCKQEGANLEVDSDYSPNFKDSEIRIGGQAGIMSNFLAKTGNGVIFYTPFLSERLAEEMDEKILYPAVEGSMQLKNVKDAVNSDRTKKNCIIEYSGEKTGRLILSNKMKGFGPYFRASVEDNFEKILEGVDRVILSGFHNAEGNIEAKFAKSREQIEKIDRPVHMEFVHRNYEISQKILGLAEEVESLGLDEDELDAVKQILEIDTDEGSVEDLEAVKQIREILELDRIHLHTLRYHITVVKEDYDVKPEDIRSSMLYGIQSAIKMSEIGHMPDKEDLEDFSMEGKYLHNLDPLKRIETETELEKIVETGFDSGKDFTAVIVPTIINEDPERVVGMGDIISSASFMSEISD